MSRLDYICVKKTCHHMEFKKRNTKGDRDIFTKKEYDAEGTVDTEWVRVGGVKINYFMIHRGNWDDVFGKVSFGASVVLLGLMYRWVEMGSNRVTCTKKRLAEFVGISRQTLSTYWKELEESRAVFKLKDDWFINSQIAQFGKKMKMPHTTYPFETGANDEQKHTDEPGEGA